MNGKKILAIIPARGGSKGIPHKNICPLLKKPLIGYTIEAALSARIFEDVIVSTDDNEIAQISMELGAYVPFLRPAKWSGDCARSIDVVIHAINYLKAIGKDYDIVVLLQPTSPLRNDVDIRGAVEFFLNNDIRSLASVSETVSPVLIRSMKGNNRMSKLFDVNSSIRRQNMKKFYCINGAIYINYVKDISENTSLNDNEFGFVISREHAIDIDDMHDMELAEFYLLKNKHLNRKFLE